MPWKGSCVCSPTIIDQICDNSIWKKPVALLRAGRDGALPPGGGLYAIFLGEEPCPLYIGQTSSYAHRIDNELLRGLEGNTMPDAEHHMAAPGLWYIQHHLSPKQSLHIAFAPMKVSEPRKSRSEKTIAPM